MNAINTISNLEFVSPLYTASVEDLSSLHSSSSDSENSSPSNASMSS